MHEQIDVGQVVTLRAVFINASGALADPTTITLTVTRPNGTTFTTVAKAGLTNTAVGKYEYNVTPDAAGLWTYTFVSSGVVDDTQGEAFLVGRATADGPCDPWCMPDDIFTVPPLKDVAAADRDYTLALQCVDAASRILFRRTKTKYPGICYAAGLRPCRRSTAFTPPGWNETWGVCSCGTPDLRACGCGGLSEVQLVGEYPILGIARVRVDGETLVNGTDYRVDDDRWLVRLQRQVWPSCNDLSLDPATDAPTWDVDLYYGRLAPPDGVLACRRLAAEFYAGIKGIDCSLPSNLTAKTVQGVSEEFERTADENGDKGFGIREVDWFLDNERLAEQSRPAIVASPDFLPAVRRTSTA